MLQLTTLDIDGSLPRAAAAHRAVLLVHRREDRVVDHVRAHEEAALALLLRHQRRDGAARDEDLPAGPSLPSGNRGALSDAAGRRLK